MTPADDAEGSAPAATAAPVGEPSPSTEPSSTEPPSTVPATTVPLVEGLAGNVELLAPVLGSRPLLELSAVDGASWYTATVYAPDGSPYWTWTGEVTAVHVGGDPVLDESVPGPSVIDGMTWGVVAFNAAVLPIALSNRQAIAP